MSTHADTKPWTVPALAHAKRDGIKLVMLTAYDNSFARVMDANGVDLVLVGDSLGMVVQGHDSTLPVTVEDIVYHTRVVARGLERALLVSDLPFQSDATPERALQASSALLRPARRWSSWKVLATSWRSSVSWPNAISRCVHTWALPRSRC